MGDDEGYVWISTLNGLNRYQPSTQKNIMFFAEDGLQSNEFNVAAIKLNDGRLFFGGTKGFNLFNPKEIKLDTTLPKAVIEKVMASGTGSATIDGLIFRNNKDTLPDLILDHTYTSIAIEYRGLHYKIPEKNLYRYKLTGLEQEWSYASGKNTSFRYANLAPGDYEFILQTAKRDENWNLQDANYSLRINPPWWQTTWAHISYLTILLILGYIGYYFIQGHARNIERKKFREQFYESISHDLQTPITLIIRTFNRLKPNLPSIDFNHYTNTGRAHLATLTKLIDQLFDTSAIKTGTWQINPDVYPITEHIQQIADQFLTTTYENQLELKQVLQKDLALRYDEYAMERVLFNLISNAIEYTPAGGTITISAYTQNDMVKIEVNDTGKGIPANEQEKIFERYQTSNTETQRKQRHGIGLSLVRQLTEAMNGHISLQSKPNIGSTFILSFPFEPTLDDLQNLSERLYQPTVKEHRQAPTIPLEPIQRAARNNIDAKKPEILVVDDHPDMLSYLIEILSDYNVITATNGLQGFNLALKHMPALIISDVMMPELNGYELSRKLQQEPKTDHIPIILVTTLKGSDYRIAGFDQGAFDVISKPLIEIELNRKVRYLLDLRDTRAESHRRQLLSFDTMQKPSDKHTRFLATLNRALAKEYQQHNLTVPKLAKRLFMTERTLERKLSDAYNMKPRNYIRIYRLERAPALLKAGKSVADTADACGFKDSSHFSNVFKEYFGVRPSKYRN